MGDAIHAADRGGRSCELPRRFLRWHIHVLDVHAVAVAAEGLGGALESPIVEVGQQHLRSGTHASRDGQAHSADSDDDQNSS